MNTSYELELRINEDDKTKKIVKIEATASNLLSVAKELKNIYFMDDNTMYISEHEFAVVGTIGWSDKNKCLCVFDEKKSSWRVIKYQ